MNYLTPGAATIVTAAPAIVAIACLFAYLKVRGGRHLLYWSASHIAIIVPFALASFGNMPSDLKVLPIFCAYTIGVQAFAVAMVFGVRSLVGLRDDLAFAILGTAAISVSVILIEWMIARPSQISPYLQSILVAYAAALLFIKRQSALYVVIGILLVIRICLTLLYYLLPGTPDNYTTLLFAFTSANLLTGMGFVLMEFDNARHRERTARYEERSTKAFLEAILDIIPAIISHKDRDLRYRVVNREMRNLLAPYYGNPIGQTWEELTAGGRRPFVEDIDRQVIESGNTVATEQHWVLPDGKAMMILARKIPLRNERGGIEGVVSCGIDITELKETEAELSRQYVAAESANKAKSVFLANMSHELRTPLNAIIGFAEMMSGGYIGPMNDRQQEYAKHIYESGTHLLKIVNDILDLSRVESGRFEFEITSVSLDEIGHMAIEMVAPQAKPNGVSLVLAESGLQVQADRQALTQVLINLLINAVKFNRKDGYVWLSAERIDDRVKITVEDTGIGMATKRAFSDTSMPSQDEAYRKQANAGAGLGLPISRVLVERQNGRMRIRNRVEGGTIVEIFLPSS
ncbi:PAS domain-containing sensor histidine kinase [Ferrovibrio sp.]|uniref:sensor histidine kinase n=1 Tax=Ferrovibrio sp. TaxID=1917215 RepID=UPI00260EDABC|nr:PAS domain-containing sensor histidine kinase [Ferrovibrio sp.]